MPHVRKRRAHHEAEAAPRGNLENQELTLRPPLLDECQQRPVRRQRAIAAEMLLRPRRRRPQRQRAQQAPNQRHSFHGIPQTASQRY